MTENKLLQERSMTVQGNRQTRELSGLYNVAVATSSVLETDTLLTRLYEQVQLLLNPDTFVVALYDADAEEYEVSLAVELGERLPQVRMPIDEGGLTGWVIRTQQPLLVTDLETEPLPVQPWHGAYPARSWLGVPLIAHENVIGAVSVQSFQPRAFTEADQRFLESVAGQVAIAIENARLYQDSRRRAHELEAVVTVASALRVARSRAEIQTIALDSTVSVLRADAGAIIYLDVETAEQTGEQTLRVAEARGWSQALVNVAYRVDDSIAGYVYTSGRSYVCADLRNDPRTSKATWQYLRAREPLSGAYVPLRAGEAVIGVLFVGATAPRTFSDEDVHLLTAIAEMVGNALQRSGLMETLEQRVVERTAELAATNKRLEQESAQVAELMVGLQARHIELEEANRQLAVANQAKVRFLANISHELRTPLNGILSISQALLQDAYGEINPRQRARLGNIYESGQHLLQLINDLLDVAKIEESRMELEVETLSTEELCHTTVEMIKPLADAKHINLAMEMVSPPPLIMGDERRLRQALLNLLANAVKFTVEGGQVGLMATGVDDGVEFVVWDSGIGIPKENHDLLFRPFSQVHGDLDRRYQGTGLGLALVKGLTELHGGRVSLDSEPGKGSRFSVWVPISPTEGTERESPRRSVRE